MNLNDFFLAVGWIATTLGIIGAIANVYKKWWCFLLWTIANVAIISLNVYHGLWSQVFLFGVYAIISITGLVTWWRDKEKQDG